MNPIATRLLSQQLISPLFDSPAELVSFMGAVQAQEYRLMRWAVAMRTKKPSHKAFEEAFNNGSIIRMHLMRGTWQLIAGEDFHWMNELFAQKATKVILGWMHANQIDLPEEEISRVSDILCLCADKKGSATKEDFVEALAEKDIRMDEHRVSYHIRMAELRGLLCNGDLLPMKPSYSLASKKIKPAAAIGREEALSRLTRKYFQSHSPATLEEFVWWSGLGIGDCRKGIAALGAELRPEKWDGRLFYVHESCRTKGFRKGQYLLIPSYDEYLIGYKSRDVVLSEQFRHKAHNNSGNFTPIIACDGIICGNWSPFAKTASPSYFKPEEHDSPLCEEWAAYRRFLEC